MAGKKQLPPVSLRTVGDDERAPEPDVPAEPMSLREAVASGSRLDELRAMRLILVTHMEHKNTLARDLAALTRQVREISKEIEGLEVQEAERLKQLDEDGGAESGAADVAWRPTAI